MIKAKAIEISEQKFFSIDGKDYSLRFVLFHTGSGKLLRAELWGDKAPPVLGNIYIIHVEVTSERNRKDPTLFYHKIKLKHYENYNRPIQQETNMGQRVQDTWKEDAYW
jgi:hypothetical protein